jgi:hypothetical protein
MKKKWFFLFSVLIILSFCFTYTGSSDAIGEQAISSKVTEHSALPEWSKNASLSENVTSNNQTITLKNPTFEEMKVFILKDTTSRKTFVLNKYECRHFATEVDNNAEAAGWRCAFVLLCYKQGQHAVVAFDTIDRGRIFIEPQTDVAIDVKVGGMYQDQEIVEILIAW